MSLCDTRKAMKMGATNARKRSLKTKHLAPIFGAEDQEQGSLRIAAAGRGDGHHRHIAELSEPKGGATANVFAKRICRDCSCEPGN